MTPPEKCTLVIFTGILILLVLLVKERVIQSGRSDTFQLKHPYSVITTQFVEVHCWNQLTQEKRPCND